MKNNKYDQISYCAKMIYEDKLISAGFVSYNNEGLSWYKVLNGCILQSVYLYSLFPRAPFLMAEGYGCHPLFIPAPILSVKQTNQLSVKCTNQQDMATTQNIVVLTI